MASSGLKSPKAVPSLKLSKDEEWMQALTGTGVCEGLEPRERLVIFYTAKNPTKIDTISGLLDKYSGNEEDLFAKIMAKYTTTPPDKRVQTSRISGSLRQDIKNQAKPARKSLTPRQTPSKAPRPNTATPTKTPRAARNPRETPPESKQASGKNYDAARNAASVAKLEAQVKRQKQMMKEKDEEAVELQEQVEKLQASLAQKESLLDAVSQESTAIQRELSSAQAEVVTMGKKLERLDELETQLSTVGAELADTEALVETRGEHIERLEEERDEVNAELMRERENSTQLLNQVGELEARLEELEELKQQMEAFKGSMKEKEAEVDSVSGEAEELQKKLKKQIKYAQTLESEVESLNTVMAMRAEKEKNRKNEEVKVVKESYESDLARLRHRTEELEAAIGVKNEKVQRLTAAVAEGEYKLEAARAVEKQLEANVNNLKQQLETERMARSQEGIQQEGS